MSGLVNDSREASRPDQRRRQSKGRTIDRRTVRALVGRLVDDRVVQATPGEGIEDGIAALNRAARRGKGTVVRIGESDVAVLPIRYVQLLERLIEQEEDRIDVEDAERRLNDPAEVPIPFEEALRQIGFGDVSDRDRPECVERAGDPSRKDRRTGRRSDSRPGQ